VNNSLCVYEQMTPTGVCLQFRSQSSSPTTTTTPTLVLSAVETSDSIDCVVDRQLGDSSGKHYDLIRFQLLTSLQWEFGARLSQSDLDSSPSTSLPETTRESTAPQPSPSPLPHTNEVVMEHDVLETRARVNLNVLDQYRTIDQQRRLERAQQRMVPAATTTNEQHSSRPNSTPKTKRTEATPPRPTSTTTSPAAVSMEDDSQLDLSQFWKEVPYTEEDFRLLDKLRQSGELPDKASCLPRNMQELLEDQMFLQQRLNVGSTTIPTNTSTSASVNVSVSRHIDVEVTKDPTPTSPPPLPTTTTITTSMTTTESESQLEVKTGLRAEDEIVSDVPLSQSPNGITATAAAVANSKGATSDTGRVSNPAVIESIDSLADIEAATTSLAALLDAMPSQSSSPLHQTSAAQNRKRQQQQQEQQQQRIEDTATAELKRILRQSRGGGMMAVVREQQGLCDQMPTDVGVVASVESPQLLVTPEAQQALSKREQELDKLFARGREASERQLQTVLERDSLEDPLLSMSSQQVFSLPLLLDKQQHQGEQQPIDGDDGTGDLMELMANWQNQSNNVRISSATTTTTTTTVDDENDVDGVGSGDFQFPDRQPSMDYDLNVHRLDMLIHELTRCHSFSSSSSSTSSSLMENNILDSFRDVLLSDDFFVIMRARARALSSTPDMDRASHHVYNTLIQKSIELHKEVALLMKQESVRHLETIREVCDICHKYQSPAKELEFLNAMDLVKPKFDISLLKFIDFAIFEEEERTLHRIMRQQQQQQQQQQPALNRTELLKQALPSNAWLQVLRMVQRGVLVEFSTRFDYQLDVLHFAIEIDLDIVREEFLINFFDSLPVVDLPYLRELAMNLISYTDNQVTEGCGELRLDLTDGRRRRLGNEEYLAMLFENPTYFTAIRHMRTVFDKHLNDDILRAKLESYQREIGEQDMEVAYRMRNIETQYAIETQDKMVADQALRATDPLGMLGGVAGMPLDENGDMDYDDETVVRGLPPASH
jgi:hypothetical protein